MLKKLLYLYNDGHNPFPVKGKGGLGYHLSGYRKRMHGDGLEFIDGELVYVPDKNMSSDEAVKRNTELWESSRDANAKVPQYSNDNRDTEGFEFIDTPEHEKLNEQEALKAEADIILNSEGVKTKKYKINERQVKKNENKFLKDVLSHESLYQSKMTDDLIDDIKLIARKGNKGYGLAFEDYLVNPENIHVLKDPNVTFTSSVSVDHPILNTITSMQGKPLKDFIVYDLFSNTTIYEIKNFGMSTKGFPAKSYDEIKSSSNPFVDIQCTKFEGNPSFKPRYILYNDGTFKVYNIECKYNNDYILPEILSGRDLKFIVMLKDGVYEYDPLKDENTKFNPLLNNKGHGKYLKDINGKKLGQIYEATDEQPFKKIFKMGQPHYKLDITKFNKIKLFKQ
jgi:hypothetical protein